MLTDIVPDRPSERAGVDAGLSASAVRHATFQLRGYCSKSGYAALDSVLAECARFYNAALQEWHDAWKMRRVSVNLYSQYRELTGVREDEPDGWGAIDRSVGRGVLRRLDWARNAFYRRAKAGETPGFPRFKSAHRWKTI